LVTKKVYKPGEGDEAGRIKLEKIEEGLLKD
jgi:hypothetical protein